MHQAQTAIDVYRADIEPTLHRRQRFVRAHLREFMARFDVAPTAKELERYIATKYPDQQVDVNVVRPRLTEMFGQGYVEHAERRVCRVTGKTVWTWRPSVPAVGGKLF